MRTIPNIGHFREDKPERTAAAGAKRWEAGVTIKGSFFGVMECVFLHPGCGGGYMKNELKSIELYYPTSQFYCVIF